jgi:hypothetical protein
LPHGEAAIEAFCYRGGSNVLSTNQLYVNSTNFAIIHALLRTTHPRVGRAFHVLSPTFMKQTFNTLAALLLAGVALCACSKDDEEEETRTTPPTEQQQQQQPSLQLNITVNDDPMKETTINFDFPADNSDVY